MKVVCIEEAKNKYDIEKFGIPYGVSFCKLEELGIDISEENPKENFKIKFVIRDLENLKREYKSLSEQLIQEKEIRRCNMACSIIDKVIEIIERYYDRNLEEEEYSAKKVLDWLREHSKDFS